ncbi:hypothetical protein CQ13_06125 [Bradyrhizobium retamae]|uniref:Uncharacterized protein n=1 Tax=Bradyrhizobium retamae TaxID=1300035 RepID=A0A0R3N0T3_9BRAD|nr:hypothetical protein CQ13_06125 [Bradyrhizobium retamae]
MAYELISKPDQKTESLFAVPWQEFGSSGACLAEAPGSVTVVVDDGLNKLIEFAEPIARSK